MPLRHPALLPVLPVFYVLFEFYTAKQKNRYNGWNTSKLLQRGKHKQNIGDGFAAFCPCSLTYPRAITAPF